MVIIKAIISVYSIIFLTKNPISIGVLLLIQTLFITILVSIWNLSSWISIIIFLILIGGLLILFIYIIRVACNEKFKRNYKIIIITLFLMFIPSEEIIIEININEYIYSFKSNEILSFLIIFNTKTMIISILIFIYIYLTIIVVSTIVKIYKGPLRSL